MTYKIETQTPSSCTSEQLHQFERLVLCGGEVTPAGLTGRINRSFRLAWALDGSEPVAVAALKRPNEGYHRSVFLKSRSFEDANSWEAELGWIFVAEGHRRKGLARKLVAALFQDEPNRNVFATSRERNDPIMPLLEEFGFVREGNPYASESGEYNLVLHLKQA
ncbi:GNAT family N-acetyltransferase [Halomonas salipaludis]|uniref:GNAT family N-acetyltransferase n=1 Tax=Halomonas salipaludis TaxID=2032625 RepID=A0A2A2ETL2_9GAMM|nr:GNAT family N-acetyltransferase [Halomonas salipaludis]